MILPVCEMTLEAAETGDSDGGGDEENDDDDEDGDDGEAEDMEQFQESGLLDEVDPSTALAPRKEVKQKERKQKTDGDEIVRTRTYDLHITYDKTASC
ncbi:unnamed protein product [Leptidea sinapis]|uniref:Uncharacterized protein n=1 Tax=Leptidea sinapis TaxID=189913 RepID=A0A5E4PTL0_9NEOP|nr:unnamed protein product [Leptidea sinapis]